ncbi:MAG: LexA repressor [Planctomycetota bacterium]
MPRIRSGIGGALMVQHVGQLIRQARQARGISLRGLAAQIGIHFSHLSKIENGQDQIGRQSLVRLSEILGLDADVLLGEAGHQGRPFRVLGDVAAGVPIEAIENVETFDLSRQYDPQQHFLLRVKGDSMILDGIFDQDLAIIRQSQTAVNGDTVVAIVDDQEATLKRYRRVGSTVVLIPANEHMQELVYPASRVRICGILAGLIRTGLR